MDFFGFSLSATYALILALTFLVSGTTAEMDGTFQCSSPNLCDALVGYKSPNRTTLAAVQALFMVGNLTSILVANNLPLSTTQDFPLPPNRTIKIPIPCSCSNGTGVSDLTPIYPVQRGDTLYFIATNLYRSLVRYEQIAEANQVRIKPFLMLANQRLWIPLPCSCDNVDGRKVVHYAHVVQSGSTVEEIAKEFGADPATLLRLNGIANNSQLLADYAFDVPLKLTGKVLYGNNKLPGRANHKHKYLAIAIGVPAALVGIILLSAVMIWKFRKPTFSSEKETRNNQKNQSVEALVTPKRYSYAEVKRMTKSFADPVGKGGYGTVYRGKLPHGCHVAVKVLKESKSNNGEDFINEVSSMSKTSHINIVSLLGFCYSGTKRALVYEFVPNGSLDKFIVSNQDSSKIGWKMLHEIALGVARGLEYLHCGCKTRIVHFDIKPQNILLDESFCPKISDFGLAKLCEKKESEMSMLDARGTFGFIAPEMISRNYGRVSHKSDVYSYGMLVLEMVGARKNSRSERSVSNSSSKYFPDWIYKDLERGEDTRFLAYEASEEEEEIARRMVKVGLWCIQSSPLDRPPMNKVVEMMEGSLDALQIPPRPLLVCPQETLWAADKPSSSTTEPTQIQSQV